LKREKVVCALAGPAHASSFHASVDEQVLVLLQDPGAHDPHPAAAKTPGEAVDAVQVGGHPLEVAGQLAGELGPD
jgi:hypothetical protein